ncbi:MULTISPECIES: hypothetical protein [Streptomyces]|uniref:hypothetical protein n=1 Tax=Streptomyces TaxID=1883 RepID=UPI00142F2A18|nr:MULTISPECIES: hypothetical protein [Streptomyces]WDI22473.1 hypothetical protein PS783_34825 [Streptomyces enissocaesilis]MBQ0878842.1 hypothetical protein [Streptomyces sp. RT42]MDI3101808.1 hypothetical protein [Streptomyces sp. AN-3]UAX57462.1 hypothetical protein K5X85_32800 [Streptomyces sp. A144]WQC16690.1 hypothetical protein TR631_34610 [Streptomyces rochei]
MRAGWCCRTVRAAVFAAVCVLLAALGHLLMSGTAVPWWAVAAGAAATGGAAWALAGRERGHSSVVLLAVTAQTVLHASFSFAQATARPGRSGEETLVRRWLDVLLCRMPSAPASGDAGVPMPMGTAGHGGHAAHVLHTAHAADPVGHAMGGTSPAGMLAAHLLAALLCGLWLAHGERAAFRIVRSLTARVLAPLRLPLCPAAPPHRPRVRPRRAASARMPRRLLLARALTDRGPPAGVAVA